jgi:O-antigen/teichoic acid export membrane protein
MATLRGAATSRKKIATKEQLDMADLRRSLMINFFTASGATLMQFIVSLILARMLSPSEIGVYSMTIVFVNIAHIFRDFGVGGYLQREATLTPEKIRSAIGVLFTSSWLIALLLSLLSGWFGEWLQEPRVVPIMRVLSLGFLVIPFGSITNSLLVRELAAEKQAVVGAAGAISSCVSCIALAALGFGTMSIAWANLISVSVSAIVSTPFRPKGTPWLPSFRHWRSIVHFGAGALVSNCAVAINNAIPDLLLGKLGSAHKVGLFSRANSTVLIFSHVAGSTVNYGAVSYLSQAHHRGESLVPIIRRATSLLTGVGWPAFALTALLGKDIIVALYGQKWLDCAPAILPLTIAAGVAMLFHYSPSAFTAIGRPYLGALPVFVTLFSRLGFGVLLFDGSLSRFAWAICLATVAALPIMVYQQRRHLGYHTRDLIGTAGASALVTIICLGACAGLRVMLPESIPALARLLILSVPMMTVWYLALRASRHELLGEVHHLVTGFMMRVRQLGA